jgi:dTDP-4-dehydrorhamnose 3,5-epimerase
MGTTCCGLSRKGFESQPTCPIMPFIFKPTALPGVVVIEPQVFEDDRGFFMETYKKSDFISAGLDVDFVQENHSRSVQGTLRGLHLQRAPRAQGKLVRAVEGEILDVAADIRRESPTFGQWVSVTLSAENRRSVYIPAGYAHGFCVVSPDAQVLYKTTDEYAPELEWGVRWDDPVLGIPWPVSAPLLSSRDSHWPALSNV